jgi:hypothetical protein
VAQTAKRLIAGTLASALVTTFAASDLSGISSLIGEHIDGIIGYPFLRPFIVTIDYRASMLALRNANNPLVAAGEELPIGIENGWALVRRACASTMRTSSRMNSSSTLVLMTSTIRLLAKLQTRAGRKLETDLASRCDV